MKGLRRRLVLIMAAAVLVSGFSFGSVAAEEEESSNTYVADSDFGEEEATYKEDPAGDIELAKGSDNVFEIYSMDDLQAALGAENVSVISDTEIQLTTDISFGDEEGNLFAFLDGTYVLDFNGHTISGSLYIMFEANSDVTFKDSTGTNIGGINSRRRIMPDGSIDSMVPLFIHGGNVTILSGKYVGPEMALSAMTGELRIEGGIFEPYDADGEETIAGVRILAEMTKVEITGGLFRADQNGLLYMKDMLKSTAGTESSTRISGGTFIANLESSHGGGISYVSATDETVPDLYKIIEDDCYLIPDNIQGNPVGEEISAIARTAPTVTVVNPTGITSFVNNLYTQALGRAPDMSAKRSLVMQLYNGEVTGVDTAYKYIFSPEALSKNLSDEAFVTLLYKVFLNRTPDTAGKQIWLSALASGVTRYYVFAGFSDSAEWKNLCDQHGITPGSYNSTELRDQNIKLTAFVYRLYKLCLNREPDVPGLNYWITALCEKNQDGAHVAFGFYFSQELGARNISDDAFISLLYQGLLGRTPDSTGRQYWTAQLNGGASRLEVFKGFIYSKEFEALCASYGIERGKI